MLMVLPFSPKLVSSGSVQETMALCPARYSRAAISGSIHGSMAILMPVVSPLYIFHGLDCVDALTHNCLLPNIPTYDCGAMPGDR